MSEPGSPTLDQLRAFIAVVDEGSFAAAARKLDKATSVISYTITNLEAQLGVALFDRKSTKKPLLTEAGRMVLADAKSIAYGLDGLRSKISGMSEGIEPEVHLVLDVMLPAERVVDAVKAFHARFPTVALYLRVEALGAVLQTVIDRNADIGIVGPPDQPIEGIERIDVGSVEMIPVAAPDHPLAISRTNAPGAARDHVQLVLTDRSARTNGTDLGVHGTRTWRLADLGSKHMLLLSGLGWGHMPIAHVQADLDAGRLVRLELPDNRGGQYRMFAVYRTDTPPGQAARFILSRFAAQN
ncbi:MAG: LysR family transcriptional regulator [Bradyrhizobium sp.]